MHRRVDSPAQREQRIQTICLLILTVFAVGLALFWLRSVMIPFVLAVFFAVGLSPVIELQMRHLRAPRTVAVAGAFSVGLVLLSLLGLLVSTSVAQLADNADRYQERLRQFIDAVVQALPADRFGIPAEAIADPLSQISASTVGSLLVGTTNALLGVLSQGLVVLIFLLFLLLGGDDSAPTGLWGEARRRVRVYIIAKGGISAITGASVAFVLSVLGVDLAMVFGLFAFLLNFIPSVGSVIATLLPLPVVLFSPDLSATAAVLAIVLPAALQTVIGNVIDPKITGGSLDLHPVTVLLALMVWGMLWGVVGMFLATPLTAVLKIICERNEVTRPVADLLAGRGDALTRV